MCEIRFAVPDDVESVREIWCAVFSEDTAEEQDRFLEAVRLRDECVLACVDGKPVSMAFFLPAVLHADGVEYAVRYLYAAATLPAYRGRGLFSDLLNTALRIFKERGADACFLNPAEPSLVNFYRRFGFCPAFFCRTVCGRAEASPLSIRPLSAEEYLSLRQTLLPRDCVAWEHRLLRYAASCATPIRIGDGACALVAKSGKTLRVIELLGAQDTVCGALAQALGCEAFVARVFAETGDCFGMLLPLAQVITLNASPYMGLAFD